LSSMRSPGASRPGNAETLERVMRPQDRSRTRRREAPRGRACCAISRSGSGYSKSAVRTRSSYLRAGIVVRPPGCLYTPLSPAAPPGGPACDGFRTMTPSDTAPRRFLLLCGLAFSGKTTLARATAKRLSLAYISLDEINSERGVPPGGEGLPVEEWERSRAVAETRLAAAFAAGRGAVLDDTGCFRWLRDRYRELASRSGFDTTIVFVDAPLDLIRARIAANLRERKRTDITDEVFARHVAEFEPPQPDEHTVRFTPSDEIEYWLAANFLTG
jgi:predicted kinase